MSPEKLEDNSKEDVPAAANISVEDVERKLHGLIAGLPLEGGSKVIALKDELADLFGKTYPERIDVINGFFGELEKITYRDDEEFIQAVSPMLQSFVSGNFSAKELERLADVSFVQEGGFTPLNEKLSYHLDGDVFIHFAPAKEDLMGSRELVKSGLRDLAKRIATEPEFRDVNNIYATSWITAQAPRLVEMFGFGYDGLISEEMKKKYFPGETRPIASSHMNKDDFLKKYGQQSGDSNRVII
jgi:hypothetical protein